MKFLKFQSQKYQFLILNSNFRKNVHFLRIFRNFFWRMNIFSKIKILLNNENLIWKKIDFKFDNYFWLMDFGLISPQIISIGNKPKLYNLLLSAFGWFGDHFPKKLIKYMNTLSIGLRPIWGSFSKKLNTIYEYHFYEHFSLFFLFLIKN